MVEEDAITEVLNVTNNILVEWHNKALIIAPEETKEILSSAQINWMRSLTDELIKYAKDSGSDFSDGKLILANTTLGSMVENWLKYFFAVYFKDYVGTDTNIHKKYNKKTKKHQLIFPENLSLEKLRQLAKITWVSSEISDFIRDIQSKRNLIHSFNGESSTLGNTKEFYANFILYNQFLKEINDRLPDVDYL